MDAYTAYMAQQIAEEIKAIEDPLILAIYLKAIVAQRCRIGGAKEGTCQGCIYNCYECRQMYETSTRELTSFDREEETI